MTVSDKDLFMAIMCTDTYNRSYGTCIAVANSAAT